MTLVDETAFYAGMVQPGDPLDLVAAIFHRPKWMAEAGCVNLAVEFVPPPGRPNKPPTPSEQAAIAVCRTCPVRKECLDYAVEHDEAGIWGGTTEQDRQHLLSQKARPGRS